MKHKSQRDQILDTLKTSSFIYFDDKHTLARWASTLGELESEGLVTTELVVIEDQYSRLEVRRKAKEPING